MILAAMSFGLSLIFMEKLNEGILRHSYEKCITDCQCFAHTDVPLVEQSFKLDIARSQSIYLAIVGIFHAGVVYALLTG